MARDCWAKHMCDVYQSRRLEDLLDLEKHKKYPHLLIKCIIVFVTTIQLVWEKQWKANPTFSFAFTKQQKALEIFYEYHTDEPCLNEKKNPLDTTNFCWNKRSDFFINFILKSNYKNVFGCERCSVVLYFLFDSACIDSAIHWRHQWESRDN